MFVYTGNFGKNSKESFEGEDLLQCYNLLFKSNTLLLSFPVNKHQLTTVFFIAFPNNLKG